ncbi:hypothetical protein NCAS_0E02630 [Naumovozyma castellii]|uniref:Thioredoxin domain-containing protein n=1 Tax=Naumovozyma castellii TaxID=27288 RepID=G0VFR6_NAUCA|nr:hypothetical protein NCAS_0E02630 [Naumovozyma castellii CBS 4309]CCC70333.1 hypothetical protein NCAS_0E02630 [Naumovozyma castellii CBS 4309]
MLRRFAINTRALSTLRLNSRAPNFTAASTVGPLNLHEYLGDSWGILFSHPADFTPVCTTEMGAFAQLKPEFDKRNVKLVGLSLESVESHDKWIKDIQEVAKLPSKQPFPFPIIGDVDKKVSLLYDMIDEVNYAKLQAGEGDVATIRSVFVIDPTKKIRLSLSYPGSVGRNTTEVLRVVDALQLNDRRGTVTPANWSANDDVIIPPGLSDKEATAKFGDFKTVKSYLRYTKG